MFQLIIFILIFSSAGLVGSQLIPFFTERMHQLQTKKVNKAEKDLEEIFVAVDTKKLFLYYTVSPLITGGICFALSNKLFIAFIGAVAGLALPTIIIKNIQAARKRKFQNQLVDALTVLASSLKGGLSFLQAMEVLVEDMPAPISQEFSLILRENKMGVSLRESLGRLNKRMQIEELELMINSILVAQETGGDLTKVFERLAITIRDNRKLKENIMTLTLQGRMQGIIMSVLPIVFIMWISSFNRHHFDIMLNSQIGKMLLFIAVALQVIGMVLIHRFSKIRI